MVFDKESEFEQAVIERIRNSYGWHKYEVINYPTEADLIINWSKIISEHNKDVDTLNGQPLTETEMGQVLERLNACRTPLEVNGFINGKGVPIIRDNPKDELHLGKEVILDLYDRRKIEAMESVYQIARQPRFEARDEILPNRRGDFMLLINGMPVIHVELKKSGVDVMVACNQIETYSHEGIFAQGIFSLVQVFIAMTPTETLYFANPGQDGVFDPHYFFHWADANNKYINEWDEVVKGLLNIPMAHQLIGYYTVADKQDNTLKVMRSYQYYAASFIQSRVASRQDWTHADRYGGHVWHTTGSGKTMTSFKAALLIAEFGHADKVVFVVDRIDLNEQSFGEYKSFADDATDIQDTKNASGLIRKLKSNKSADQLIITSIQKLSHVRRGHVKNDLDIDAIAAKRLVFIFDECHRDTFGEMYINISNTFPCAMFFGFTGTPILPDNQRKNMTTASLFGDDLHKYTIGCGIRDKNVLGLDQYMEPYDDTEVRQAVALWQAKAKTPEEALADKAKAKIYTRFMNMPMGYTIDANGKRQKGIEDYVPIEQYECDKHRREVVKRIKKDWTTVSYNNRFHAILATSSIAEAIAYYRLFKELCPEIKATAMFDDQDDFAGNMTIKKEDALKEMLLDYKAIFGKEYKLKQYDDFRKDVCNRMAHKEPYQDIEPDMQLHLVIVVDQLLTGYDSKWVNALYLDKVLEFQNIIQAFSRTNRLNGEEKKFGIIKYYRYPHTMKKNIERAIDMYSKDEPLELFVDKLPQNIESMNRVFIEIETLFRTAGIDNFERLPNGLAERAQFAKLFKNWQNYIDSARLQGFVWEQKEYKDKNNDGENCTVSIIFEHSDYISLLQRYKELARGNGGGGGGGSSNVPYAIDTYITQIRIDTIDADYINSRFGRYMHIFNTEGSDSESARQAREDLHKAFASLSAVEQKYAYVMLSDFQKGKPVPEGKTFREMLVEYQGKAESDQIHIIAEALGVDEEMLRELVKRRVDETTIDSQGKFEALMGTANLEKAKECIESIEHKAVHPKKVKVKIDSLLRRFLFADDAGKESIAKEIAGEYIKSHPDFNMGLAHELTLETAEIKINGDAKIETNQVHIHTDQVDQPLMAAENGGEMNYSATVGEDYNPYPESTLDSIFHRALNVPKVKETIANIIIMKGEEGKFRLTLKQTFILHKVLEEIDWLDDDTDTTFIQWFDDVFKWPWETRNFKSVKAGFKHSHSMTWDENTVNDPNTGREYRLFADYVREQFVDIGQDGSIKDKVVFMNLGSDGKPMYIGHGLKRK